MKATIVKFFSSLVSPYFPLLPLQGSREGGELGNTEVEAIRVGDAEAMRVGDAEAMRVGDEERLRVGWTLGKPDDRALLVGDGAIVGSSEELAEGSLSD